MEKKLATKPRIIIYGTDESILLAKPHVVVNEVQKIFEISYIVPQNLDYHDFKFLPMGNELVVRFNEDEIFRKRIDLWIEPSSVTMTYKKAGSFLIISGTLIAYDPQIHIHDA